MFYFASLCQTVPTNTARSKFPKYDIFLQIPQTTLPSITGFQSEADALEPTSLCRWMKKKKKKKKFVSLNCTCTNRCLLHLLSDNRVCSVGWSCTGCRLISDILLSCSEWWRIFTFTDSALKVTISDKSFFFFFFCACMQPLEMASEGEEKYTFSSV